MDSGAECHVSGSKDVMYDLVRLAGPVHVVCADGATKYQINFKGKIVRKGSIRKGKLHEMDQLKRKSCKKRINANLQLGCHGNTTVWVGGCCMIEVLGNATTAFRA